jgi:hypothetical protein
VSESGTEKSTVEFIGEFAAPSPWRGNPTPEIDAAWEALDPGKTKTCVTLCRCQLIHSKVIATAVPKEEVERLGKLRNSTVQVPSGGYLASIAAFHQIHCLVSSSSLRIVHKVLTRWQHVERAAKALISRLLCGHRTRFLHLIDAANVCRSVLTFPVDYTAIDMSADHCIEMLRQVLMCNADLHLIVYDWVSEVNYPWADFATDYQCRDYQKVYDWGKENSARTNAPGGMMQRTEGVAVKTIQKGGDIAKAYDEEYHHHS